MRQAALVLARLCGLDDDRAVQARVDHRFVVVRVIDERPRLIRNEMVDEVAAVRNERLRDARDAVHVDRYIVHSVHMNRVGRRAFVVVIDDDGIALPHDERGSRHDAVVGVGHHGQPRLQLPGRLSLDDVKGIGSPAACGERLVRSVRPPEDARLPRRRRGRRNRSPKRLHPEVRGVRRDRLIGIGKGRCRGECEQRGESGDAQRPKGEQPHI